MPRRFRTIRRSRRSARNVRDHLARDVDGDDEKEAHDDARRLAEDFVADERGDVNEETSPRRSTRRSRRR